MNEMILIWVYLSAGSLVGVIEAVLVVLLVVSVIAACFTPIIFMETDKSVSELLNSVYKCIPKKALLLALFLVCLYPSKDDLKYIIGGSLVINGVQAASDIEGVEKLPKNLVNAMNVFLEKAVEENE